eukprot:CAMPEP_0177674034 /NCGR_PEP_ID=MMETSP0447-20121125/26316_1 /TAXON_ID=0 /ORGANISM="Stygamoeba regulata, Strain BSH-02190019" /LENGTH=85 /DNA_ID=CAMNT_0019182055 /DNA_START=75 /DNA_END=332 /DNA_ORIENTATION=-
MTKKRKIPSDSIPHACMVARMAERAGAATTSSTLSPSPSGRRFFSNSMQNLSNTPSSRWFVSTYFASFLFVMCEFSTGNLVLVAQ